MSHFTVTLTFDKDIPSSKTSIQKLKKEINDKIWRVEWLIKEIDFNKSDISCKGNKAFITFVTHMREGKKNLTPKIITALKGSKWSKLYLNDSLKATDLKVVVKEIPGIKQLKKTYKKEYKKATNSKEKTDASSKYHKGSRALITAFKTKKKRGGGKGKGRGRGKTKRKSKAYITKEVYKAWEKTILDRYYSDEKKKTPIIPTNGNPSYLKQSKWILFLDINNVFKQASSKNVKVADLPVKQKKSLYHIGTKRLDNVSFGYDSDEDEFKYPALDLGGNTVFRSKLKTSYETKFNFKLTKDTKLRGLSTNIYDEWIKLLGKTKIIGVTPKDIEKWLSSVIKLLKEDDYIILRFFQLPTTHRVIITQSDIRKLTGKYYERIYGLSEEEYAMDSNNKKYYTMVESHFANPNITKQNILNEHSSYKK